MLLRSMQKCRRVADAKAENDALRDDVALLVVVGCTASKQSVSQCVKPPPPPAWIMQPPRLADTAGQLFHPRGGHYAKTTGRNPESILMSSADELPYRWATHALL